MDYTVLVLVICEGGFLAESYWSWPERFVEFAAESITPELCGPILLAGLEVDDRFWCF